MTGVYSFLLFTVVEKILSQEEHSLGILFSEQMKALSIS